MSLFPPSSRQPRREGPLRIDLSPATALMGTPFSFRVTGLKPGERVVIKGSTIDRKGVAWNSQAEFLASAQGAVDLEKQAPAAGSYAGTDIFGLLWSMKPPDTPGKRPPSFAADETNGWTVDFTVTDSAGSTATARLLRVYQMPGQGLVRIPLREDGMAGFLYCPAKGGPFPGVIILGGAGGGLYEWLAQAVASNGFAALTLAYFNYADLPAELVEIPLEYFHRAAAWLKGRPEVRADRIGLAGGSKGGELALLLASRYDDFRAVVAWTPAAHSWEGHSQKYFAPDYKPVALVEPRRGAASFRRLQGHSGRQGKGAEGRAPFVHRTASHLPGSGRPGPRRAGLDPRRADQGASASHLGDARPDLAGGRVLP
ncbi:MAG: acyl-CoA thioesterase/BAAT N-terminal domain-containing protein [Anaerotruncus sp.]|nr:acyl-CoA thioesterase/BAAT N-terminal domain-containing protein [Anaerotruncus sp.]